ncbi:MAG: DUF5000 domain-containing lipoprotein [Bacteroidia bacterium]|nr:DUF5000 domain-containing lipoprotein [Bacteroidia bacterium]
MNNTYSYLKNKKMKKYIYLLILPVIFFSSCKEDYIGQFPVDKIAPLQVSNVLVSNLPGTVKLKYDLPDVPDLLYVKAVYKNSLGETKEVRSSVYSNLLEINGFGRSVEDTIQLIAVDRSQNESTPLRVAIKPLDSPIFAIMDSMKVKEAFGGIKFETVNPLKVQVVANVSYTKIVDGLPVVSTDAFYFTAAKFTAFTRGLDSIPYNVTLVIHDIYGNSTDTLHTVKKPIFEMMLPGKTDFKLLPFSINCQPSNYMAVNYAKCLWDGITNNTQLVFYLSINNPPNSYFGFDMGKSYILSRMKMWQRVLYPFSLHNPRIFEIWGTNDETAAYDAESFEGWTLLNTFQSHKPSGDDNATVTAEDKAYVLAGEDFEFTLMDAPVRYLRFRCTKNWTNTNALHLEELSFWGAPKN